MTLERSKTRKIVEAEIMSEKGALRITLTNPEILGGKKWRVIEGYSWGIEPDFDEAGEELDSDVLVIDAYYPKAYFRLRDEDIAEVKVASEFWKAMGEIDDAAEDGVYIIPADPVDFDVKAAAKYVKEHGISGMPEEVREMFKYEKRGEVV